MVIRNRLLGGAFHPKESYFSILLVHFPLIRCGVRLSSLRCHPSRFVVRIYDIATTDCLELM